MTTASPASSDSAHRVARHECAAEIVVGRDAECLSRQSGYEAVDTLRLQIADLLQSRFVSEKLDAPRLRSAVDAFLAERGPDYGVWAHYPWARRLVRVLPEADFIELRTNRNQHKITAAEQRRLASKKIGVVGLSVGQSVALTLALERSCGELRLADHDTIDLSNLNRLRCGIHNIGLPKTVAAAREIAELDPYLKVDCFDSGYTQDNSEAFLDGLDAVIDECDSLDVKLRLREAARARGIPVLMNTSDRGMTDIERFDTEPDRLFFHGRMKNQDPETLADLSTEEKVPIVLDIIGLSSSSVRLRASMMEIEQSIKTWPQLASDVTLGGAIVCDAARRLLLGEPVESGRYYMDLAQVGSRRPSVQPNAFESETHSNSIADQFEGPLDSIIADAILAPSAGNVQPWQWQKTESGLVLKYRRTDQAGVLYHDDKAAMVGLGATLESAIISSSHHGFQVEVEIDTQGAAIASLSLVDGGRHCSEPLHAQLVRRRSVRTRPRTISSLPDTLLDRLCMQAARFPGLKLAFLSERRAIESVAELVGEAERLRILDPDSHADMVREIAWSEHEHRRAGEGIPLSSLSLSAAEEATLQILRDPDIVAMLCEWDLGGGLAKLAHEQVSSSSAIGLLWSATSTHGDYLSGGRALQRVWLEATRADVGLCPVTPLCYLLGAWRAGRPVTELQAAALPEIDKRFRAIFGVPESRADIALFRLLPAADELNSPRSTLRRRS
ncbi:Rv1355c family protein [Luteimonas sp. SX5]|uniref:Rv1355c family protein n=1 Tax=Luteimonas galliterrae TaxID=2940486 RepID=A0ABT0MN52_9GAMM|nr:Rv1355c family protein [Luteimonas galliterrae]MCL1636113.1 Rv1355c family protein [Luteimonas galliterrae]